MRKLVVLFALCWASGSLVRAQSADPVRQQLDQLLGPLDKTQVPTAFLAEYATPLVSLPRFSQPTLVDSARTDMDIWRHLYATWRSARVRGTDTLPTMPTLNARVAAAEAAGPAIPLAVQYAAYARLRPDAETAGLVRWQNGQLTDVPGRSQSPYQTSVLFAAAPTLAYSATGSVSLVPRRNLYVASGAPSQNVTLSLDFGDGRGHLRHGRHQAHSGAGHLQIPAGPVHAHRGTRQLV